MSLPKRTLGLATTLILASLAHAQVVEDFEAGNPNDWQIDFNGTFLGTPITPITGTLAAGNPGSGLSFTGLSGTGNTPQTPWWLNTRAITEWSGDLRAKGVDGFGLDMNYTTVALSPFGWHMYVVIADDNGTPDEYADDILCWSPFDGAQYGFNGAGPQAIPAGQWSTVTWPVDAGSTTLPSGWTCNTWDNSFVGDPDVTWNAMIQDVDYVAFVNSAPWGGTPLGEVDVTFDNLSMLGASVGEPYCFCDGTGSSPPCGNTGATGNGCANGGNAAGANLSASGTPSASASSLMLIATGSAANQPGLFFQGTVQSNGGQGLLFGDGLRCAGTSVIRLEVVPADASGEAMSTIDIAAKGGVSSGDTRYYQYWYRDPLGSPCGMDFNLTNGLALSWSN